jgi:acyl-CoA synthetase (AMP-forming)/AMP-acid ligase II/thioesterase domain-containing protein
MKTFVPETAGLSHPACAFGWLRATAASRPEEVVLSAPALGQITYGRLSESVENYADFFRLRFSPDSVVALGLSGGAEQFAVFLAVNGACVGAPLDPGLGVEALQERLVSLGAEAVVVDPSAIEKVKPITEKLGISLVCSASDDKQDLMRLEEVVGLKRPPESKTLPLGTAAIVRTSASTGPAKLVPLTHENLAAMVRDQARSVRLTAEDRILSLHSLFHMHGLLPLLSQLYAGGSIAMAGSLNPRLLRGWLEELRPTWYTTNQTTHRAILAALAQSGVNHRLRFVRNGGGPIPDELLTDIEQALGVPALRSYGSTEAGTMACESLDSRDRKPGSNGRTVGPELSATDGRILVRGDGVTSGYWTRERGLDPLLPGGWLSTGDLGYLDSDGFVFITGREKDVINRGGQKISPQEVDEALGLLPGISEAVAFALPHPTLGEDVACAVVKRPGEAVDERGIRTFLSERLEAQKVPRQIFFLDKLPRGDTGKLQRGAAADICVRRMQQVADESGPATLTPLQNRVRTTWQRMLKVENIGPDTDFFVAGGDSLSAMVMLAECSEQVGLDLGSAATAEFLDKPTLVTLARLIEAAEPATRTRAAVVAIQPAGSRVPLFCLPSQDIEALQFLALSANLGPEQPLYAVRATGGVGARDPIEVSARRAADAILSVRSDGPYVLAGYSYGGAVAGATASILLGKGKEVRALVLLDAGAPGYPKVLRHSKQYLKRAMSSEPWRTTTPAALCSLASDLFVAGWRNATAPFRRRFHGTVTVRAVERAVGNPVEELRTSVYRIPSLPIPVFQFLAGENPVHPVVLEDPRLSWRNHCLAGFHLLRTSSGEHGTLLDEPHIREVARMLAETLSPMVCSQTARG